MVVESDTFCAGISSLFRKNSDIFKSVSSVSSLCIECFRQKLMLNVTHIKTSGNESCVLFWQLSVSAQRKKTFPSCRIFAEIVTAAGPWTNQHDWLNSVSTIVTRFLTKLLTEFRTDLATRLGATLGISKLHFLNHTLQNISSYLFLRQWIYRKLFHIGGGGHVIFILRLSKSYTFWAFGVRGHTYEIAECRGLENSRSWKFLKAAVVFEYNSYLLKICSNSRVHQ